MKRRCREVNEYSNAGWVARDVRESCIRMDGHSGKHRNHRWEWVGHSGTPVMTQRAHEQDSKLISEADEIS